jgi:Fe-S-cluster-containing dehydrogenase component
MRRFQLEFEEEKCWGCMTCEVACKQENHTPEGQKLIFVSEEGPEQVEGRWRFLFRVNRCRHCDTPPCAEVCPTGAIVKREDGIVVLSEDECAGCGSCVGECPYGSIAFDEALEKARKCNLCHHRVDQGLLPACADNICLAHCIHFKG